VSSLQVYKFADDVGRCFAANRNVELPRHTAQSVDEHVEWLSGHQLISSACSADALVAGSGTIPPAAAAAAAHGAACTLTATALSVSSPFTYSIVTAATVTTATVASVDITGVASSGYCQCNIT